MVKKNDWKSFSVSNNPSIIRKYMDACETNIISTEEESDIRYILTPIPVVKVVNTDHVKSLGISDERLHYMEKSACYFCKSVVSCKEDNIISGNPFTRMQFMIVCKDCQPIN